MIGIISDIHGNAVALRAVLDALDTQGVDRIFSLGDVAGYYTELNECIDLMRSRRVTHILGNHDWYLISGLPCPRSESANRCLEFQRREVTTENLRWLEGSAAHTYLSEISMVHGGWHDPLDEYLYRISESYFAPLRGRWFFSGHTHVQGLWPFAEKTYCNPGSVGQPRDGDPRAAFATWDNGRIELHRTTYDIEAVARSMSVAGFESFFYENLRQGTRIGGATDRVMVEDTE